MPKTKLPAPTASTSNGLTFQVLNWQEMLQTTQHSEQVLAKMHTSKHFKMLLTSIHKTTTSCRPHGLSSLSVWSTRLKTSPRPEQPPKNSVIQKKQLEDITAIRLWPARTSGQSQQPTSQAISQASMFQLHPPSYLKSIQTTRLALGWTTQLSTCTVATHWPA